MTWMTALRDHPDRPPAAQRHVLNMLALRLDWSTGCGFASTGQLASDADVDERTVRRATSWARDTDMLVQTRRGHRITADRVIASEWSLTLPVDNDTQQDTGDLLDKSQPDRAPEPTGQSTRPNRTAAHHHLDLGLQDLGTSERRRNANGVRTPTTYGANWPPALYATPAWCGKCERQTHMREDDQGRPYRCPDCHPANRTATS